MALIGPSWATRQALPPPSTDTRPVATTLASIVSGSPASSAISSSAATAAAAPSRAAAAAPALIASVLRSVALASPWLTAWPQAAPVSSTPNGARTSITAAWTRASRCSSDSPLGSGVRYGYLRERRRELHVGLELLPRATLVVAERDLAQARVENDLRRRVADVVVAVQAAAMCSAVARARGRSLE